MPTAGSPRRRASRRPIRQFVEGGWIGISVPAEFGGQGLPATLTSVVNEFLCSANMAFAMYPGLTQGAIAALLVHGSPAQKAHYLPKMVDRRMDRHDEPDRAALRHRPRPAAHQGGRRRATAATRSPATRSSSPPASTTSPTTSSTWCWPASRARRRAPGASRCSSCPSSCPRPTARSARATRVSCGSIEEKMGIHGNATCVMNYDGADRLADRRGEPRPAADVHDDERGAARRRRAGPGAVRSRLPDRRRLRQGAPAGPLAHRARNIPTSRPTRSSCTRTCAAC